MITTSEPGKSNVELGGAADPSSVEAMGQPTPVAEEKRSSTQSHLRWALERWPLDRWLLVALTGLAVATGVFLRVSLLSSGSLWTDELWTFDAISRSFKEMYGARLITDQSPPLWTLVSWVWLQLIGTYDTASMRILPVIFSCLGIAAPIVGAVRMRALRPTLLVMASLLAVSLFTVQYAVEFRTYSMMIGLGAVATVIWVGLLTAELPRSGRWIFAFALSGALAGFGHYYGNVLYLCELAVLLAVLGLGHRWRPVLTLLAWGALSMLPVTGWYVETSRFMSPGAAVPPPSLSVIGDWLTYAFAPVSSLLADDPLSSPEGARGDGVMIAGLIAMLVLAALISYVVYALYTLRRKGRPAAIPPTTAAGAGAVLVVVAGICCARLLSLVMEPTMSIRHLAALLPALFLAAACACTLLPERVRSLAASIAIAVLLAANGMFVAQYGGASLTPPWQAQAGYRDAVRILIAASRESPRPTFIGLNTAWLTHSQWDASIRAELGARPAISSDPEPLAALWVNSVQDIEPGEVPPGPVVVFSDYSDQRTTDLFAWAEKNVGSCRLSTTGGPGYGLVRVLRCG